MLGWAGYGVGVLAGVAFAIKPYYALLWLAIEGWLQLRNTAARAWLRPENRAIVGVQIPYAGAALLLASDYLDVVEMAMVALPAYSAFGSPMLLLHGATLVVLLAAALYWLIRDTPADRELRDAWLRPPSVPLRTRRLAVCFRFRPWCGPARVTAPGRRE